MMRDTFLIYEVGEVRFGYIQFSKCNLEQPDDIYVYLTSTRLTVEYICRHSE